MFGLVIVSVILLIIYLFLSNNPKKIFGLILAFLSVIFMNVGIICSIIGEINLYEIYNLDVDVYLYNINIYLYTRIDHCLLELATAIFLITGVTLYFTSIILAIKGSKIKKIFENLLVSCIIFIMISANFSFVDKLSNALPGLLEIPYYAAKVIYNVGYYLAFIEKMISASIGALVAFGFIIGITIRTIVKEKKFKKFFAVAYPLVYVGIMLLGYVPKLISLIVTIVMAIEFI